MVYMPSFQNVFCMLLIVWIPNISGQESPKEVCYPVIGCFSLEAPWNGFWRPNPESPEEINIKFYAISRNTQDKTIADWRVKINSEYRPRFGRSKKVDYQRKRGMTVFHIYGFGSDDDKKWERIKSMANAYLSKQDVNIIVIDWDANSHRHDYRQCVSNTRIVAAVAVKFIEDLIQSWSLTADRIHLIGFSLGAHIAGYVGKQIHNIHRITALDAAQPGFEHPDDRIRLHHTDAQHVDVLHTNARPFFPKFGLGYISPIGDVDFYFNGGKTQPGCWKHLDENEILETSSCNIFDPKKIGTMMSYGIIRCSHHRAMEYWIEAIQSTDCIMRGTKHVALLRYRRSFSGKLGRASFRRISSNKSTSDSVLTDDYSPVGLGTFTSQHRGVLQVRTNSQKPFCIQL